MNKKMIAFGAKCELARRRFFYYCKLKAPDFYREDRPYIVTLCDNLQKFIEGDDDVLILNLPPRFGKSRTAQNLVEWILGKDKTYKIMTGSYNETLSTNFAKGVRNSIQEEKADDYVPVFSDVFAGIKIKAGDGAMNLWSLEGGYNNYLATSPSGTATGFGCNLLIIDDLIKSAKEAYNDNVKQEHWSWFTNTMLSRLEEGGKIIIIMTRWASDDLAGKVLTKFTALGKKIMHINLKAKQDDGSMLCKEIFSAKSYEFKRQTLGIDIFMANYQQEPIDLKGCLYSSFKTYDDIPRDVNGTSLFSSIKCYTDTADTGEDYLCSIVYGEYNKEAYVLDVLYTKEPMEITEPAQAKMLVENNVNDADIESNNGGRGYARNVGSILQTQYNWNKCHINWFHQSANKKARILSNATWVMEHIYFPANWKDRWPEYYEDMNRYQREGKNAHDDAPDATTGIAEKMATGYKRKINPRILRR